MRTNKAAALTSRPPAGASRGNAPVAVVIESTSGTPRSSSHSSHSSRMAVTHGHPPFSEKMVLDLSKLSIEMAPVWGFHHEYHRYVVWGVADCRAWSR